MSSEDLPSAQGDGPGDFTAHALARVNALRAALQGSATLTVTIAGDADAGTPSLGKGAAVKQWTKRFGMGAHRAFVATLDAALLALAEDFPERVYS